MIAYLIIASIIAIPVSWFVELNYAFIVMIAFFAIYLLVDLLDIFSEFKSTKCPECNRSIKTSLPVKCVECGGAALLTDREKRKLKKNR
jgi:hypothetical protein